uniref:C-type lectin domain-containing protein n=1 Tax=Plectus sambesii TaxID=2011161 RepID=A0A914W1N4_9BILA
MYSINTQLYAAIVIAAMTSLSVSCPDSTWTPSSHIPTRCYLPVTQAQSWFAAENYCKGKAPNAHISSIANGFESAEVAALLEKSPGVHYQDAFWLGANDLPVAGQFQWTDGTAFTYTNWYRNQPNKDNDCVLVEIRFNSKWITADCGKPHFFVCAV